jgi:hypothetical protein
MADRVADDLGVEINEISEIVILPDPTPEVVDGKIVLRTTSGAPPLPVLVTLANGESRETQIQCPGIAAGSDPACMEQPRLHPMTATLNGYRDVPCSGEPPDGCATPHPGVERSVSAAAVEIRRERVDIPIDHVGRMEVRVGQGSLPNGILTEASFRFADDWPDGLTLSEPYVLLDVRSLEPDGKPFDNYYTHGRRDGVERVEAVLVFDVKRFDPGATLSIRDVVVR